MSCSYISFVCNFNYSIIFNSKSLRLLSSNYEVFKKKKKKEVTNVNVEFIQSVSFVFPNICPLYEMLQSSKKLNAYEMKRAKVNN